MVSCSGALLDKKCRDMAQKFFGCKVVNMYGMTEVSSLFSCRTIEPKRIRWLKMILKVLVYR